MSVIVERLCKHSCALSPSSSPSLDDDGDSQSHGRDSSPSLADRCDPSLSQSLADGCEKESLCGPVRGCLWHYQILRFLETANHSRIITIFFKFQFRARRPNTATSFVLEAVAYIGARKIYRLGKRLALPVSC